MMALVDNPDVMAKRDQIGVADAQTRSSASATAFSLAVPESPTVPRTLARTRLPLGVLQFPRTREFHYRPQQPV
jgi:hypothetical protein